MKDRVIDAGGLVLTHNNRARTKTKSTVLAASVISKLTAFKARLPNIAFTWVLDGPVDKVLPEK